LLKQIHGLGKRQLSDNADSASVKVKKAHPFEMGFLECLCFSQNMISIQIFERKFQTLKSGNSSVPIHKAHMTSIKQICSKDHTPEEIRAWGGRSYDPSFRIPAIQNHFYIVAEHQNQIEGFSQLHLKNHDGVKSAYLNGLYLTPAVLKKQVGGAMMKTVLEYCRCEKVQFVTLSSSITSFDFYKKFGFIQNGELGRPTINGVVIRGYPMRLDFT